LLVGAGWRENAPNVLDGSSGDAAEGVLLFLLKRLLKIFLFKGLAGTGVGCSDGTSGLGSLGGVARVVDFP
jgi:hypothetical protein